VHAHPLLLIAVFSIKAVFQSRECCVSIKADLLCFKQGIAVFSIKADLLCFNQGNAVFQSRLICCVSSKGLLCFNQGCLAVF
jgi:hypothetical protein